MCRSHQGTGIIIGPADPATEILRAQRRAALSNGDPDRRAETVRAAAAKRAGACAKEEPWPAAKIR
jgi:hypothetical protein